MKPGTLLEELGAREMLTTLCVTNPSGLLRNEAAAPGGAAPGRAGLLGALEGTRETEIR
jgi:hypothetical protein